MTKLDTSRKTILRSIWLFGVLTFGLSLAVVCEGVYIVHNVKAWKLDTNQWIMAYGAIIAPFSLAALSLQRLYKCFSDLWDINDILFIVDDINLETKANFLGADFRKEIWNQINRRAEKEKVASLQSLDSRFTDLKDWLKIVSQK